MAFRALGRRDLRRRARASRPKPLPVGGTLDTGAREADLKIGTIGVAHLGSGHARTLDATSASAGHNLHLAYGHDARARQRAAAPVRDHHAVDRGHRSRLRVRHPRRCERPRRDPRAVGQGRARGGRRGRTASSSSRPPGRATTIRPGQAAGLPIVAGAGDALVRAVAQYERGEANGIAAVLAAAERQRRDHARRSRDARAGSSARSSRDSPSDRTDPELVDRTDRSEMRWQVARGHRRGADRDRRPDRSLSAGGTRRCVHVPWHARCSKCHGHGEEAKQTGPSSRGQPGRRQPRGCPPLQRRRRRSSSRTTRFGVAAKRAEQFVDEAPVEAAKAEAAAIAGPHPVRASAWRS